MNIWKKSLLTFFAIFIVLTSIFPKGIQAQTWYAPTLEEFTAKVQNAPENEIFGERYTQAQIYWILYSLVNFAIGQEITGCTKDPVRVVSCLQALFSSSSVIPGTGVKIDDTGVILPLASLVDQTIRFRPASGIGYLAEKLERLNLVDNTYAQEGFGYETLAPTSKLWVAARDASYALSIIVIVVLAFMIMFRTKISPQASLTVQIAMPRIVIALVLITFSFAIAGLLIDIAYLALGIIGAMFSVTGISNLTPTELFDGLQHWGNGMVSIGIMLILYLLVPTLFVGTKMGGFALSVGIVAIVLLSIVVLIIYLVALAKILWVMFKSMLMVTLLVVFSPLYCLWGVFPSSGGYGNWMKSFVGHLSLFVSIPLMIFFANVIMWGSIGGASLLMPNEFLNPYGIDTTLIAGGMELPGFFGGYNPVFGMIGGLILLLSAPKLGGSIRDQIITGRAQFGTAGLEAIPGATTIVGGTQKEIGGRVGKAISNRIFGP